MSGKRAKLLRKSALAYGDDMADSVYRTMKKGKSRWWMFLNKAKPTIQIKRHPGELKGDFKARRKKCNTRRRHREKARVYAINSSVQDRRDKEKPGGCQGQPADSDSGSSAEGV